MPLDADLERFVSALEQNTKASKELVKVVENGNKKYEIMAEQLKVMFEGDPGAKVPPLNIQISQLCYLMSQLNMSMRVIITILGNATRVPKMLGVIADLFKK